MAPYRFYMEPGVWSEECGPSGVDAQRAFDYI